MKRKKSKNTKKTGIIISVFAVAVIIIILAVLLSLKFRSAIWGGGSIYIIATAPERAVSVLVLHVFPLAVYHYAAFPLQVSHKR